MSIIPSPTPPRGPCSNPGFAASEVVGLEVEVVGLDLEVVGLENAMDFKSQHFQSLEIKSHHFRSLEIKSYHFQSL